jgi:hypothetical protein
LQRAEAARLAHSLKRAELITADRQKCSFGEFPVRTLSASVTPDDMTAWMG